jgi:hypothetical protein
MTDLCIYVSHEGTTKYLENKFEANHLCINMTNSRKIHFYNRDTTGEGAVSGGRPLAIYESSKRLSTPPFFSASFDMLVFNHPENRSITLSIEA